jgi:hypothetical protein
LVLPFFSREPFPTKDLQPFFCTILSNPQTLFSRVEISTLPEKYIKKKIPGWFGSQSSKINQALGFNEPK